MNDPSLPLPVSSDEAVNFSPLYKECATQFSVKPQQVHRLKELLDEGCTLPFIARYRKEHTGHLDDLQVREISQALEKLIQREERRGAIISTLSERGALTPELHDLLKKAATLGELEEIYAPYKQKRKTRGDIARDLGLEPLAKKIQSQSREDWMQLAQPLVNEEKGLLTVEDVLQGARYIVAEVFSRDLDLRRRLGEIAGRKGRITSRPAGRGAKAQAEKDLGVFETYRHFSQSLSFLKAHQTLALLRGEKEGLLKIEWDLDALYLGQQAQRLIKVPNSQARKALEESLERLLIPSLEREFRSDKTEEAESRSIEIFASNLRALLLQPPLKATRVLAIDPGLRTGCKWAALDESGKLLGTGLFFSHQIKEAVEGIQASIKKYQVNLIALGNGTGSTEVQSLLGPILQESTQPLFLSVVPEDGASVYSASPVAREEFPDLDVSYRGAVSIGRRLQDPLSELVKIEPASLGVGLYQHDLPPARLSQALDGVVETVVNQVGVNLNSASYHLLGYVSGIRGKLARALYDHRQSQGPFKKRSDLLKVKGLGAKAYQQCAGFLRIPGGKEELDNSWIHPEDYDLARAIQLWQEKHPSPTVEDLEKLAVTQKVSVPKVQEIREELARPALDPREDYPAPLLIQNILSFEDLKPGQKLQGRVKNIVDFGAFVDIGIKENGLLHVSEMADRYVKDPWAILQVGQELECRILNIDPGKRRIALSLKL